MRTPATRGCAIPRWTLSILILLAAPAALPAAELQLLQPLNRTAYQTNEWIDLAIIRQGKDLAAGDLVLRALGADGSKLSFTFAVPAAPTGRTEHLHLDGRLLRPGHYTIETQKRRRKVSGTFLSPERFLTPLSLLCP